MAPQIGPKGFGLADDRVKPGKRLRKAPEPAIDINVVDNDRAARRQNREGLVHLEANVALAMETIVDEEIDCAEARDQPWEPPPAGATNVGPSAPKLMTDRYADLVLPFRLDWRAVDAE